MKNRLSNKCPGCCTGNGASGVVAVGYPGHFYWGKGRKETALQDAAKSWRATRKEQAGKPVA